ncbi:hypothetical protein FACS1894132_14260 [Clostridia bacterium]|nr:hypothetical protein FACS1894132_14260 [Clostridia bacterium]
MYTKKIAKIAEKNTSASKIKSKIFNAKSYLSASIFGIMTTMMTVVASATGGANNTNTWSTITGFLTTWIPRIGGAVIVFGLIQLGISFQQDNAEGKTRAIQVIIGGAIVAAVATMINTFMK